jgi:hypothetical protein
MALFPARASLAAAYGDSPLLPLPLVAGLPATPSAVSMPIFLQAWTCDAKLDRNILCYTAKSILTTLNEVEEPM